MITTVFENLPLIVFGLVFFVSSIILITGIYVSASAKDTIRLAKGKRILIRAAYSFSSLLLIVIVFSSITWFLERNSNPPEADLNAHPVSPVDPNFPLAPESIEISDYHFNGPYPFLQSNVIAKPAIFTVLCENEGDYDIIDIDSAQAQSNLNEHENADCWATVCENIYVGTLLRPTGEGIVWSERSVVEFLKNENSLLCPIEQ